MATNTRVKKPGITKLAIFTFMNEEQMIFLCWRILGKDLYLVV
jgi:hypothetical protein